MCPVRTDEMERNIKCQTPSSLHHVELTLTVAAVWSPAEEPDNTARYNLMSPAEEPDNTVRYNLMSPAEEPDNTVRYNLMSPAEEPDNTVWYNLHQCLVWRTRFMNAYRCQLSHVDRLDWFHICTRCNTVWFKQVTCLFTMFTVCSQGHYE